MATQYVTTGQLAVLLGRGMVMERAAIAVAAANHAVAKWCLQLPDPETGEVPDGPVTGATTQAALELAQTLYRRQAATGGFVDYDDLVARLPADLVRGIRDLLDLDTRDWGLA